MRYAHAKRNPVVAVVLRQYLDVLVRPRGDLRLPERNKQVHHHGVLLCGGLDRRHERIDTDAVSRRDKHRIGVQGAQAGGLRIGNHVHLVEADKSAHLIGVYLGKHFAHHVELVGTHGTRRVHNDHGQIGFAHFVEGGFERLDQAVRQFLYEAHRVGEGRLRALRQGEAACRGVQRGEELVVGEHIRAGQAVHQRGLARVGVAGQDDAEDARARPFLSLGVAAFLHAFQLAAQHLDPVTHEPAVHLQLRFTLAETRAHAAAHAVRC